MDALSAEERSELAKRAAEKRWGDVMAAGPTLLATHGDPDHPLRLADIEIPCYVLADDRRVIVQSGMLRALGMSQGTASAKANGDRLSRFIATKGIQEYVSADLASSITQPIRFRTPSGSMAYGYEATVLADLCNAVLDASDKAKRENRPLNYQQDHIVIQCHVLIRAFAKVGIIALVDEATGFQRDRANNALAKLLEAYIAKELQPWISTFPGSYYENLFRLRGLDYPTASVKRPQYFGILTNDIVYNRLDHGVLDALRKEVPRNASGRPTAKFFQKLTTHFGYRKLVEHLGAVVAIMKVSKTYAEFHKLLDEHYPPKTGQLVIPGGGEVQVTYDPAQDSGEGL